MCNLITKSTGSCTCKECNWTWYDVGGEKNAGLIKRFKNDLINSYILTEA